MCCLSPPSESNTSVMDMQSPRALFWEPFFNGVQQLNSDVGSVCDPSAACGSQSAVCFGRVRVSLTAGDLFPVVMSIFGFVKLSLPVCNNSLNLSQ